MVEQKVLLYLSAVYIYIYFLLHVYGNFTTAKEEEKTVKETVKAPPTTLLLASPPPDSRSLNLVRPQRAAFGSFQIYTLVSLSSPGAF